ncbi:MAG: hypothetical protein ACI8ZM_004799 [Crocinitomix sp.]|jgi:hypothetical protein
MNKIKNTKSIRSFENNMIKNTIAIKGGNSPKRFYEEMDIIEERTEEGAGLE